MLLIRLLFITFVALASARSSRHKKRACKPNQKPLNVSPTWSNSSSAVGIIPVGHGSIGGSTGGSSGGNAGGNNGANSAQPSAVNSGGTGTGTGTGSAIGAKMSASFTKYGTGDDGGSGTCASNVATCGFFDIKGYNAAISQNIFGAAAGQGAGPGCGKCYALTLEKDASGGPASGSILIKANNLCPAAGNPLCAMNGMSGTNSFGANVHFDLCIDNGAAKAFFPSDIGAGSGHAVEVECGNGFVTAS